MGISLALEQRHPGRRIIEHDVAAPGRLGQRRIDGRRACGDAIAMRELDFIRVIGREAPLAVYEPICLTEQLEAGMEKNLAAFARALALYRNRDFTAAAKTLETLAPDDFVAAKFAARAREMIAAPPPPNWQGINELAQK